MTPIDLLERRLDEITHPHANLLPATVEIIRGMLLRNLEPIVALQDLLDVHAHLGYRSACLVGEACATLALEVEPEHVEGWIRTLRGEGYNWLSFVSGRERTRYRLVKDAHQIQLSHVATADPLRTHFMPTSAREAAAAARRLQRAPHRAARALADACA